MKFYLVASILAATLVLNISPVHAEDQNHGPQAMDLQVSRVGDIEMSCGSLAQEALIMRDIVGTTQSIKDRKKRQSQGVNAVGAVGSFVLGTVTGGVGLAAAGLLIDHNIGQTSIKADNVQDIAKQRRSLMVGIYNAKGCHGPIEHVMIDPEDKSLLNLASIEPAAGEENIKPPPRTARYNN